MAKLPGFLWPIFVSGEYMHFIMFWILVKFHVIENNDILL